MYCGLLSVILFVFFLLSRRISLRKKLLNCALLGFLFLSLNCNKLDFMWHGFHFPNQLPYRYSFVVSFLLVILAYEAFLGVKRSAAGKLARYARRGQRMFSLPKSSMRDSCARNSLMYVCCCSLLIVASWLFIGSKNTRRR